MAPQIVQAILLAAGQATRFNTGKTKLIEPLCGQEMILYPAKLLSSLNIPLTVVIGHQKELIKSTLEKENIKASFIVQAEQKGTGHAVICTKDYWHAEHILIMNGDMPLVTPAIINNLVSSHLKNNAAISFIVAHHAESNRSYGRIVKTNNSIEIVEAKDFTGDPHEHCCINAGIYLVSKQFLHATIEKIRVNEKTREFYITDLIKIASEQEKPIEMITVPFDQVRGINTLEEFWAAEQIKRAEIIRAFMQQGVSFSFAHNVHIDVDVTIGSGTQIGSGVHLRKGTRVGDHCIIKEFSSLENSVLGNNATVFSHSIIKNSRIGNNVQIGPFAHLKDEVDIDDGATVGNFVEMKQTRFGKESKAKHLTYLGNTTVGDHVNIGAGTITCNHNGVTKEQTIIEDHSYIGSNTTIVAPVTIEENAFTAAGSVITQLVPANALAIARSRQINKEGYAEKIKNSKKNAFLFSAAIKSTNDNHTPDQT